MSDMSPPPSLPDVAVIYKIVSRPLWKAAKQVGRFEGAGADLQDGYIHFSTAAQLEETAVRDFAGARDVLLVAVDVAVLGEATLKQGLVFEPLRGGALFPHFYGVLPLSAALWEAPLSLGADGAHRFPEMLR